MSFLVFAADKIKAVKGKWRISENNLLIFAFFGPFGALFAIKVAHHKTHKKKFLLVYLFLLIHLAVMFLYLTGNF